jgi:hypothetical protein
LHDARNATLLEPLFDHSAIASLSALSTVT